MTGLRNGRKAQVFSIDVLFSLLPVAIILGASLQYMYLVQEESKSMAKMSELEVYSQSLSNIVMSEFAGSWNSSEDDSWYQPFVINGDSNCDNLTDIISGYNNVLLNPDGRNASIRAVSYWGTRNQNLCNYSSSLLLTQLNNTASSQERFMIMFDDSGNPQPGRIAGVSIAVWDT